MVTFISFLFSTAKDLMLADSLSLNSTVIFIFLRSREAAIFSSIFLNFLFFFFYFSHKNQQDLILHSSLLSTNTVNSNSCIISSLYNSGKEMSESVIFKNCCQFLNVRYLRKVIIEKL